MSFFSFLVSLAQFANHEMDLGCEVVSAFGLSKSFLFSFYFTAFPIHGAEL